MNHASLFGASALLLAACGGNNDTASQPADTATPATAAPTAATTSAGAPNIATEAPSYIARAGAADMWEIESSRALLAKSANAAVKDFAQMMIDQHRQSTAKIKAAAGAADIEVAPPRLAADQQRMLDDIRQADAAEVDAVYLRHQRTAHDAAFELHNAYAASGDTDHLKKAASEITRVIETHRRELGKLGASNAPSPEAM
jgi:putative membrane protein